MLVYWQTEGGRDRQPGCGCATHTAQPRCQTLQQWGSAATVRCSALPSGRDHHRMLRARSELCTSMTPCSLVRAGGVQHQRDLLGRTDGSVQRVVQRHCSRAGSSGPALNVEARRGTADHAADDAPYLAPTSTGPVSPIYARPGAARSPEWPWTARTRSSPSPSSSSWNRPCWQPGARAQGTRGQRRLVKAKEGVPRRCTQPALHPLAAWLPPSSLGPMLPATASCTAQPVCWWVCNACAAGPPLPSCLNS